MKSKAKFLPLVLFAAVLVSLVFIIPVFSATGTVKIVDPADNDETIRWAKQGGTVTLEVDDPDLDVPVKRVLLPHRHGGERCHRYRLCRFCAPHDERDQWDSIRHRDHNRVTYSSRRYDSGRFQHS